MYNVGLDRYGAEERKQQKKAITKNRRQKEITEELKGEDEGGGIGKEHAQDSQTVLMQLKAEGIVPKKGNGGVAFVVTMSEPSPSSGLPRVCRDGSSKSGQGRTGKGRTGKGRTGKGKDRERKNRERKNRERKRAEKKAKCTKKSRRT
ncbi:uncharacterized protein [Argopecten irradians]|uniref:uncharacterized protein n=1 Tax=Argopecten irradians TaxID=31199 RepID=UPI00371F4C49